MNKYLKIVLFGFLLWLIPFTVSVFIFPLRTSQRPLFESIMPVVIAIWTVFFSILYLSRRNGDFLKEGVFIGLAWLTISIILDLMIFATGPLKMPPQGLCDRYCRNLPHDPCNYLRLRLSDGASLLSIAIENLIGNFCLLVLSIHE